MRQYFDIARENMVNGQILPNRVTNEVLIEAMRHIPREKFLPTRLQSLAYADSGIALGNNRYMPEPLVTARILQEAAVQKTDVVLDVGCGTGYTSSILGYMAKNVIGLEQDKDMVMEGVKLLDRLGIKNTLLIHQSDLHQGYAEKSPYNVILINGAVPEIPEKVKSQLAEGGRLVTVLSNGYIGSATLITRHGGSFSTRSLFDAATPMLSGFEMNRGFVFQ